MCSLFERADGVKDAWAPRELIEYIVDTTDEIDGVVIHQN